MDALKPFNIPLAGISEGIHEFDYQIDNDFFTHFEASPISKGSIEIHLILDKQPDMIVLNFDLSGKVATQCDRCLADIMLPIAGNHDLIVKYLPQRGEEAAELVYIESESTHLHVATFAYEFICLSIPMSKTYDCEEDDPLPCNEELLNILDTEKSDDDSEDEGGNPIWDALKDLKK